MPIPIVSKRDWKLAVKIHLEQQAIKFAELPDININRGEINQTLYRKYISENCKNSRLIKGAQIGKFCIQKEISQGKIEWFNEVDFIKVSRPKKGKDKMRIATQRITGVDEKNRIVATIIQPPCYFADSTNSIWFNSETKYDLKYILGILNSNLIQWRFKITSTNNNVGTNEINILPFRKIDFKNEDDLRYHSTMVELVMQMLEVQKKFQISKTDRAKELYQKQINILDRKIDKLVYELYGLTDDEIRIMEGSLDK